MIARILNAYFVEITKAIRLRFTYVGPVLVVLAVLAAPLAYPIARDQMSDYGFAAYAVQMALNILGFLMILLYCANLIASETASGTIRSVLLRPIYRREFFIAKALMGLTYATVIALLAGTAAWCMVFLAGDLAGVYYGGEMIYTDGEMRLAYIQALALGLLPLYAGVAYALLISVCARNTTTAVGTAIGLWIFTDTVKYPLNVAPYLFSSYLESPWTSFVHRANAIEILPAANLDLAGSEFLRRIVDNGILPSLITMLLCFALGLYVLSKKDFST